MIFFYSSIAWRDNNGSGLTFAYTDIILFAISKDSAIYDTECVYMLLESMWFLI